MRLPTIPPELTTGPFTVAQAHAAGLTRRQLQSPTWRRLLHGVYVWAGLQVTPGVRLAAVRLLLPPDAVVAGRTAAWLHGADVRDAGGQPVELIRPRGRSLALPGVVSRQCDLGSDEVVVLDGVPVTSPARTAYDLACHPDLTTAVVGVDAMLNRGGATLADLARLVARHRGARWIRTADRALTLAEPLSESPMETRLRLLLVLAGLPRPEAQWTVVDARGEFLGRVDLAYPEHRLAIEYDGQDHALTWRRDMRRRERMELLAGWRVRTYGAEDVYRRPAEVVWQVRRALQLSAA